MIKIATTTPNVSLHVTPRAATAKKVSDWRNEIGDDTDTSNMMKIDKKLGITAYLSDGIVDTEIPVRMVEVTQAAFDTMVKDPAVYYWVH